MVQIRRSIKESHQTYELTLIIHQNIRKNSELIEVRKEYKQSQIKLSINQQSIRPLFSYDSRNIKNQKIVHSKASHHKIVKNNTI